MSHSSLTKRIMPETKLLFTTFFLSLSFSMLAQCPSGEKEVRIQINTDVYWYEVHWSISNLNTGEIYVVGAVPDSAYHEFVYCIPDAGCTKFTISDDYGDGMSPDGFYRIFVDSVLVYENIGGHYEHAETVNFGCPPGSTCESALPVDAGQGVTPDGNETWYVFVPQDTGIYQISTCDSLNTCDSKIWVYSKCQGITLSENQTGADFYASEGCDNGAVATLFLAGGQDYFIRLRHDPNHCDTTPIHFTLIYEGPIRGCTDPAACNYEPLATVSDTCIYPGNPNCPQAPDLVTREDVLRNSMEFYSLDNPDQCAVNEGCLRGLGARDIIRFTTFVENIGDADYYIGYTPATPNTPSTQFVYDPCHGHWHYLGYADYILFDENGYRVPIGSKTGFCVLDLICPDGGQKYTCTNMGISAGCADAYDSGLPCQWIDITDIPAGTYTFVLRVNWDKSPDLLGRVEKSYDNNWAQACFRLTYPNNIPEVEFLNDQCPPYVDCAGEIYGDAQPDCNGICKGPALRGDVNQDTMRTNQDVLDYLALANADNGDPSSCLDLDDNGSINIYDAALLQECNLHKDNPQYWIQRFPCNFPAGVYNQQDLVSIKAGVLDTMAKTLDLEIINPSNKILGYEFSISGLHITSMENLAAGFDPNLRFNAATGEIIGMGLDESVINKNFIPEAFLRVHYDAFTSTQVCVEKITAVVNSKYQLSNADIVSPACIEVGTSATVDPASGSFRVFVQPNPFKEKTTVFFENESGEAMNISLTDLTGKVLRRFEGVRENFVTFERNNLPAGTYFFSIRGAKGSVTGKLIAE